MATVAFDAMSFAVTVHAQQKRKYGGEPYITHLAEVAGITATVHDTHRPVAVAWLHDCMEDCNISFTSLHDRFGHNIAYGVKALSDLEEGNRAYRKQEQRYRLNRAPDWVQDIKCADLLSNGRSIKINDPKFWPVYREEGRLLLDAMKSTDSKLHDMATNLMVLE